MTPNSSPPVDIDGYKVIRVPPELRLLAAERVIGGAESRDRGSRAAAARKFVDAAEKMGIDISHMWGTLDHSGRYFHHVCLAVLGAGRTAMLFVSEDEHEDAWDLGDTSPWPAALLDRTSGVRHRDALLRHVCAFLGSLRGPVRTRGGGRGPGTTPGRVLAPDQPSVILVQALLEADESESGEALVSAGFLRLGDLTYMRRPLAGAGSKRLKANADSINWPVGIRVRPFSQIDASEHDGLLGRALARTYIDTLDCPELCGLRTIEDVIDSHRAVGVLDLSHWWLVEEHGLPEGVMLLSECPDQNVVELVYLGLSPTLRGRGLGAGLLKMGLAAVSGGAASSITCAVDTRNAPATKLYKRAGFQRFATRVPMVKGL